MPDIIAAAQAVTLPPLTVTRELDTRLSTRISKDVDRRLRVAAVLQDLKLGDFLDQLLGSALPTYADLSVQMNGATSDEC
jgi:hypothetical protein